jgi:hypothetical protein
MKKTTKFILSAAASLTLISSAMAQYRTGSDGHLLDANNRIGSGGLNSNNSVASPGHGTDMLGNDIVTGNVTGGQQFRGFVPYTAPTAFRGNLPGEGLDRFVAQSSGAPIGNIPNNNAQVVQPFIGASQFSPQPQGFVQQPGSNAYVPQPPIVQQPSDARLGQTLDIPQVSLPAPGQLILPGPVDPNTQTSSVITASPLYGVREWNSAQAADQAFLANNVSGTNSQSPKLDPVTLQKLRSELTQPPPPLANQLNQQQNNPQSLNNAVGVPLESPLNQPLNSDINANPNGLNNGGIQIANNLSTGQSLQQQFLISPQQQSTQYAALQQRFQQYAIGNRPLGTTSQQRLNQQRPQQGVQTNVPASPSAPLASGQAPNRSAPMMVPPSGTPSSAAQPATPSQQPQTPQSAVAAVPQITQSGEKPRPLQIHSLAEGVQAKGLADLLTEAETQMKAGHFHSALEQYELAEQVAPNNPLILLGRANAELGQSYYTRADTHLRQAFSGDQALLMGQYDLNTLLGQDRLQFLVSDLKAIAQRETKESRPLFLLAYIAYNTGSERKAAAYLDLAEKRAGGSDPVYDLVRKYWSLPSDVGQNPNDALNK